MRLLCEQVVFWGLLVVPVVLQYGAVVLPLWYVHFLCTHIQDWNPVALKVGAVVFSFLWDLYRLGDLMKDLSGK